MPPQAQTYFPEAELVTVRLLVRGRVRPIVGAKTGIFYGRFKAGDEFQIHRDDYAAHPVWFQLMKSETPPTPVQALVSAADQGSAPPATSSEPTPFELTSVAGVGEALAQAITQRFGIESAADLTALSIDQLTTIPKVNAVLAQNILQAAAKHSHADSAST